MVVLECDHLLLTCLRPCEWVCVNVEAWQACKSGSHHLDLCASWQSADLCHVPSDTGFFENKEADAKARGEAPVKKKTAAEEYDDFMTSIATDVRDLEAREQTEAVEAATERQEREAFEQW